MTPTANISARLPCPACREIVPDRRQVGDNPEASSLETFFEREDSYPTFPSIASSAQAGCTLCVLLWRRLTSIPAEAIDSIKDRDRKLVWVLKEQRLGYLTASWDQKVKIRAEFDFLPYPKVSTSGPIDRERAFTSPDGHQYGGAVILLSISCRPIAGALRLVDGTFWHGEKFEFSVFDSIGMVCRQTEVTGLYSRLPVSRFACTSIEMEAVLTEPRSTFRRQCIEDSALG
jgi:hypothetical protein